MRHHKTNQSDRHDIKKIKIHLNFSIVLQSLLILVFAAIFSFLTRLVFVSYPGVSLLFTFFILAFGLNLVFFFFKKKFSVLFFLLLSALLTWNTSEIAVYGWEKVLFFLFAGIVFEFCSFIFKNRSLMNWLPWTNLIGTILSLISILIIVSFYLSTEITLSLPQELINIYLISMAVSFLGMLLSFFLWEYLHDKKFILKIQGWLGVL